MNFDRLAPHYDWLETLTAGGRLQQARTVWLDELAGRRRILSAGEGHGRFVEACATRFPEVEIMGVESSKRMLARALTRTRGIRAHCRWHGGDLLAWEPDGRYDAVVTCFFLDCFPPEMLEAVVTKLAACATADATWLVVDFAVPSRGLAGWRARSVHALMYAFFRCAVALPARRLTPPDPFLRAHGFVLAGRREFEWGLVRADLWRRAGAAGSAAPATRSRCSRPRGG